MPPGEHRGTGGRASGQGVGVAELHAVGLEGIDVWSGWQGRTGTVVVEREAVRAEVIGDDEQDVALLRVSGSEEGDCEGGDYFHTQDSTTVG